MQDTITRPKRMRRSPRPRLRVRRVIFVLLLILIPILWHFRPSIPELVCGFPARGEQLWVRAEGFFTAADDAFAMRLPSKVTCWRWYGTEAWTLRLPKPDLTGWRLDTVEKDWNGRAFSVAPGGVWSAVAWADGPRVRVITWHKGQVKGRLTFPVSADGPFTGRAAFRVMALDDGRAALWLASAPVSPILVIEGNRMLATAEHRSKLTMERGIVYERVLSPDMRRLIGFKRPWISAQRDGVSVTPPDMECASLELTRTELTVYQHYTITHVNQPILFNGAVVGGNGAVFRQRGEADAPDGWTVAAGVEPQPDCAVQYKDTSARVIAPASMQDWGVPRARQSWRVAISEGGRFALAYDASAHRSAGLSNRFSTWEVLTSVLFTPRRLNLYERPGRLIRAMKLPNSRQTVRSAYLSPDAARVLMRVVDVSTHKMKYLLYRMPPEVRRALNRE